MVFLNYLNGGFYMGFFKDLNSFINKSYSKLIILIFLVPLFCSCGKKIEVLNISSFVDQKKLPDGFSGASSFFVVTDKKKDPLFEKEICQKIEEQLDNQNYIIEDLEDADYYLTFTYDITSTTSVVNVAKYIPGETTVTSGSIYGQYGWYGGYTEQSQSSGSIVYVPETYTSFNKFLFVRVYDADLYRKTNVEDVLWEGSVISCGENNNLRTFINYLLQSLFKCFGKNAQIQENKEIVC